jgi:DNA-directed RNA polymerase III subunit RPC3
MAIRVNHERYTVLARNQRLVEMVEQIIHPTPALVFAELLKQLSPYIPRCQDPLAEADDEEGGDEANRDTVPTISTYDLAQSLRPDIDLEGALGKAPSDDTDNAGGAFSSTSKSNGKRRRADSEDSLSDPDTGRLRNGSRAKRTTNGNGNLDGGGPDDPNDDDDDDDDDNDDDGDGEHGDGDDNANDVDDADAQRVRLVEQHLRLLAQSPPGFVRRVRRGAHDEWAVDCARLVAHAQRAELEALVAARFGAVALRVMRILAQRGSRLDEKQLANAALVRARDLRATLTAMHAAGVLELQEVPRDGARQASRTLFLWFFDAGRAARRLVDGVYQAMARLLQRAAAERAGGGLRVLLAKAERTDVVGHEDEYLSAKERRALQQWRDKEERLLGQMMRLDRLIELFRDF